MIVYVVISECGLNEHVLHYAGPERPTKKVLRWFRYTARYQDPYCGPALGRLYVQLARAYLHRARRVMCR